VGTAFSLAEIHRKTICDRDYSKRISVGVHGHRIMRCDRNHKCADCVSFVHINDIFGSVTFRLKFSARRSVMEGKKFHRDRPMARFLFDRGVEEIFRSQQFAIRFPAGLSTATNQNRRIA
jgi:hypothetical protein